MKRTLPLPRMKTAPGYWAVRNLFGLFKMTDLTHEESQLRFARQLRHMGVDDALRAKGVQDGDLVRIENLFLNLFNKIIRSKGRKNINAT